MSHRAILVLTCVLVPTATGLRETAMSSHASEGLRDATMSSLEDILEQNEAPDGASPSKWEWLLEKARELEKMGKADILLGAVALGVYRRKERVTNVTVRVKDIKSIHPVGEWRQDTWAKTHMRAESVRAGKEILMKNNMTLTQELTFQEDVFAPMRSIGQYIAVDFPFGGKKYVTLEGNGRLKAIALAAEQDPELEDLKVEVALFHFSPEALAVIQKDIMKLWNRYVEEGIKAMKKYHGNGDEQDSMVKAYLDFRLSVVKCQGFDFDSDKGKGRTEEREKLSGRSPGNSRNSPSSAAENFESESPQICPMVKTVGGHPQHDGWEWVDSEELVEVDYVTFGQNLNTLKWQMDFAGGKPLKYYKIRGRDLFMVGDSIEKSVKEYCPMCFDIK